MFPKDLLNAPLESIRYEWDLHRERFLCGLWLVPLLWGFCPLWGYPLDWSFSWVRAMAFRQCVDVV